MASEYVKKWVGPKNMSNHYKKGMIEPYTMQRWKEKVNFESERESNQAELEGLCRKDKVGNTVRQVFGQSLYFTHKQ